MNYRKGELIGEGGMSHVYEGVALPGATVPEGTIVALKYLRRQFLEDTELLERFFKEVETSYNISSVNITRGLDIQKDEDVPVFVMERLYGQTLRLVLENKERIEEERALQVALSVAYGLSAAHAHNIVHRDIKPGNIHLGDEWPTGVGSVKLLDFGVAKIKNSQMTQAGARLGTPHYMSPEQIESSSQAGPSADLYALGIVLYEMLMGVPPFYEGSDMDVMRQHLNQAPPDLPKHFTERTRTVVRQLLAKTPAQRVPSASEAASELQMALVDVRRRTKTIPTKALDPALLAPFEPSEPPASEETIVKEAATAPEVTAVPEETVTQVAQDAPVAPTPPVARTQPKPPVTLPEPMPRTPPVSRTQPAPPANVPAPAPVPSPPVAVAEPPSRAPRSKLGLGLVVGGLLLLLLVAGLIVLKNSSSSDTETPPGQPKATSQPLADG